MIIGEIILIIILDLFLICKNKKSSLFKLLFVFPLAFFKSYIIKRSFLNGTRGFIASMNNSFYAYLKEAKLYELNNKK